MVFAHDVIGVSIRHAFEVLVVHGAAPGASQPPQPDELEQSRNLVVPVGVAVTGAAGISIPGCILKM